MSVDIEPNTLPVRQHIAASTESRSVALVDWQFARSEAGICANPEDTQDLVWRPATVPGTVAAELLGSGSISNSLGFSLDDEDFWYRVEVDWREVDAHSAMLHLHGLATIAEVWLDEQLMLTTDNMFRAYSLGLSRFVDEDCEASWLSIRFSAMTTHLGRKFARAKWRSPFVQHRNLRYLRTSLLGRTPGLQPLVPIVGPWQPIVLELGEVPRLELESLSASLVDGDGRITIELCIKGSVDVSATDELRLCCGAHTTALTLTRHDDDLLWVSGCLQIDAPKLWFPHTHGVPNTYTVSVEGIIGGRQTSLRLHPIGFRLIQRVDPFAIWVNGVQIFCRGACWRPIDLVSMNADAGRIRELLQLAVDAGINMLRITGESVYETNEFYRYCDELGIMVWQDFMFARLDYPIEDRDFLANVMVEATQVLERLAPHPCLSLLCGNTEVAQQAAMLGLEQEKWSNEWFREGLRELCSKHAPSVPYWQSSPDGGDMPFYAEEAVSHYFEVGAYRGHLSDAIVNAPVFASECLAFAIQPLAKALEISSAREELFTPADAGANWSFQDVTDHYVNETFRLNVDAVKAVDRKRYDFVCGLAIGEVMYAVQIQWRRQNVPCNGSLLIALNDSFLSNGWGIVDANSSPKIPYYFCKRAWKPLSIALVDQGINGLKVILHNDLPASFSGRVELAFFREDGVKIHSGTAEIKIDAHASLEYSAESMLGHFVDSSYAYQFGPPAFDIVLAELFDAKNQLLEEAVFLPRSSTPFPAPNDLIDIDVAAHSPEILLLTLRASSFVQSVTLLTDDIQLSDNCFHLLPDRPKSVVAKSKNFGDLLSLKIRALNVEEPVEYSVDLTQELPTVQS